MLRAAARRAQEMESQARASRVSCLAAQSAAAHQSSCPARASALGCAAATQSHQGVGLRERHPVRRPARATAKRPSMKQPRSSRHRGRHVAPHRCATRALEQVALVHGAPTAVRIDKGPEFLAQASSSAARRSRRQSTISNQEAGSVCLDRTLQPDRPHRGPQRPPLGIARPAANAPRQPRQGAAAHVSGEASTQRPSLLSKCLLDEARCGLLAITPV
jgi:hypothetical protein